MKRYFKYLLAATILMLGLVSCKKTELHNESISNDEVLYQVTIGAKVADETKTSMANNGDINWTEGDQISVLVAGKTRTFTALSGGTTTAEFSGYVTAAERKALTDGTAFTATYPASGAVVSETQTFVDGNFADNTFPMTGQGANSSITFTNPAAVVMAQDVEIGEATSATLSYTANETQKTITLNGINKDKANLLFVVEPGADCFSLTFNETPHELCTSKTVEAGKRYKLYEPNSFVAIFDGTKYLTLEAAIEAAETNGSGTVELLRGYNQYPQAWVTDCIIDEPNTENYATLRNLTSSYPENAAQQSYYTFHSFNPSGDEALATKYVTEGEQALSAEEKAYVEKILGQVNPYLNWNCDFEVYFNGEVNGGYYYLAGNYGNFGWLCFQGVDLDENKTHKLLGSYGIGFTYEAILQQVFNFHCGIISTNDEALLGKTFSVELCMYDPDNDNVKILIGRTDYTFKPVAKFNSKEYGTLKAAVDAAIAAKESIDAGEISGTIELCSEYDQYPQAWITDCTIGKYSQDKSNKESYYTFHAFNPNNGDENLASEIFTTDVQNQLISGNYYAINTAVANLSPEKQVRANKILTQVWPYGDWVCDYEVKFNSDVTEGDYCLVGNYQGYAWVEAGSKTLQNGEFVQLLHSALGSNADQFNYTYMLAIVNQFHCGIYSNNDTNMAGKTVSVELYMYYPNYQNIKILISRTDYTF